MKHGILPLVALLLASCSSVNQPACKLPSGVLPLPKSQTNPPQQVFTATGGVRLPYTVALPQGRPKAVVVIVPGWDSTTEDYASIASALARHGYAAYSFENRTFVYGPHKLQGTAKDWHPWVEDVKAFSRFVKAKHPGLPVYWHGQSFGAVEVIEAAAETAGRDAPAGLIVHSPAYIMLFKSHDFFRDLLVGSVDGVTVPQLAAMDLLNLGLTTDDTWNCRWLHSEDRLRKGYKVRFLDQAVNMGIEARRNSHHLPMPVLAIWGGKDRLTLGGIESLRCDYNKYMTGELNGGRAKHRFYPAGGHLLTEGDAPGISTKRAALHEIVAWLDAHH